MEIPSLTCSTDQKIRLKNIKNPFARIFWKPPKIWGGTFFFPAVKLKVGKLPMLSEAKSMQFLVPFYTNGRNQNWLNCCEA